MDLITLALSKKYTDKAVGEGISVIETAMVFDTETEMNSWLAIADNIAKLKVGSNLYIRDLDVPDYWWDGTAAQILETQKVNLSEYSKTTEVEKMIEDSIGIALGGEY